MIVRAAVGILMFGWWTSGCAAEARLPGEQAKSPNAQLQDIKAEVLDISGALARLEERLLYPENSRTSVFLQFGQGVRFSPGRVSITIDGKLAVSHLYTPEELAALRRGGAQRIYTGNLPDGEHSMEVEFIGDTTQNDDDHEYAEYRFSKVPGAKFIEVTLTGLALGSQSIIFKD